MNKIRKYLGESYNGIYLTKREFDTLAVLVHGRTYKEAAYMLGISKRTVESYINKMKSKLGCKNKNDLIHMVMRSNLGKELFYAGMEYLIID